jgi:hypothetical protein
MKWARRLARMGWKNNLYSVLVDKPEGKRPVGRYGHRWEDTTKMALREIGWGDMDWINLAQDTGLCPLWSAR